MSDPIRSSPSSPPTVRWEVAEYLKPDIVQLRRAVSVSSSKYSSPEPYDFLKLYTENSIDDEFWQIHYVTRGQIIKRLAKIERRLDRLQFAGTLFFSHSLGYRKNDVSKTAIQLVKSRYFVTDYRESLDDNEDVQYSDVFLMFYNEQYKQSLRCQLEVQYALKHGTKIIIICMDSRPLPKGWPFKGAELTKSDDISFIYYPNNRQFDDFLTELIGVVKEKMPVKTKAESGQHRPAFSRFRSRDRTVFIAIDVPCYFRYYTRREVELRLITKIQSVALNPVLGALVVGGEAGIGKTCTVSRIFTHPAYTHSLIEECGIRLAIWIDCLDFQMKDSDVLSPFNDRLVAVARKADPLIPSYSTLNEIMDQLRLANGKVLIVLENLSNPRILAYVRRECEKVPIIAVTRDPVLFGKFPELVASTLQIEGLEMEHLTEMLEKTLEIGDKLPRSKLDKLATLSRGSPLIACLIGSRFDQASSNFETVFQQIINEDFGWDIRPEDSSLEVVKKLTRQLVDSSLSEMDESQKINFIAFLFYSPDEPIVAEEIGFFWGFPNMKARALCHLFVKQSLITQIDKEAGEDDKYVIHSIVHEAAVRHAKRELKASDLVGMRLRLATGSARRVRPTESGRRKPVNQTPDINVLCEAVNLQNFSLLEKIFNKLGPDDLTVICCQKSPQIPVPNRNFLHFLYHSSWNRDKSDLFKDAKGEFARFMPNSSYDLILKFLVKTKASTMSTTDIFFNHDSRRRSLIGDIFDDEEIEVSHNSRHKLICQLSALRIDYLASLLKENVHPLIKAIRRNEVDSVSIEHLDKHGDNCLIIASRLGRMNVVDVLLRKFSQYVGASNAETGSTPISTAAYYGHLDVLRAFFSSNHVDSVECLKKADNSMMTPLMLAARNGHDDCVKFLAEKLPSSVLFGDSRGYTAIAFAAINGHIKAVITLQNFDQNCAKLTTNKNETPLHLAAHFGQLEVVQFLYTHNPESVKLRSETGETALMAATSSKNFELVIYLFEKFPEAIFNLDNEDKNAIMVAAQCGRIDAVELFVTRDLHGIELLDCNRRSVLSYAAESGSLECTQLVFSRYPDAVEMMDDFGRTPLMVAAEFGHLSVISYLFGKYPEAVTIKTISGYTALMLAAKKGHVEVVDFLHQKDVLSVTQPNNEGQLPLTVAALSGNKEILENLYLKHQPAIREQDETGSTAFMHAVVQGNFEIISLLNSFSSDAVKVRRKDGTTPLMAASVSEHADLKIVEFVYKSHPDAIRLQNSKGYNALMIAVIADHLDVVKFLCEKFPDSTMQRDTQGRTASYLAAMNNHLETLTYLGSQNRVTLRLQESTDGLSPLMIAARNGHYNIVRYLCKEIWDAPQVENNDRQPALFMAAISGHLEIVKFLYNKWPPAVDHEDVYTRKALRWASLYNQDSVVEFLKLVT